MPGWQLRAVRQGKADTAPDWHAILSVSKGLEDRMHERAETVGSDALKFL